MSVGVQVGSIVDEVGASSFLNAFFSTIAVLLENDKPGSRYPVVSKDLYQGCVPADRTDEALTELLDIKARLDAYPPNAIVWDREDRSKQPPWKSNISKDITSMGNYFVSSTGRDLFDLLLEAFEAAHESKRPVSIVDI